MNKPSLHSLVEAYFRRKGYNVRRNVMLDGFSGLFQKFDLLLQKENEERIVLVMDWKRPVGVNMVIKADKAAVDINISNPIIVARNFSSHAKAYSNRRRITLLTERELLSNLHIK